MVMFMTGSDPQSLELRLVSRQIDAMRSEELQENRIKRGVDRAIKACASRTLLGDGRFKSLCRHPILVDD